MSGGTERSQPKDSGWHTIRRSVTVARPFESVTSFLVNEGDRFFGAPSGAEGRGLELAVCQSGSAGLPRTVLAHLGGVVRVGERILVPVSWADFGRPTLFTVLKAVIEVVPADAADRTIVVLVGRCRPPLGRRDEEKEYRSGSHIVVEAVTAFVTDLAARLEAELAPIGQ